MSHLDIKSFILGGAIAALALYPSHKPQEPKSEVTITVDTMRYFEIEPITVTALRPRPTPPSAQPPSTPPEPKDTLYRYQFADTVSNRWSASIVGRDVRLESLIMNDLTRRETITTSAPPRWRVMALTTLSPTSRRLELAIERNFKLANISLRSGYDFAIQSPTVEISAGVTLWRK